MTDHRPPKPTIFLLALLAGALPAPVSAQSTDIGSYVLFAFQELRTKGVTIVGSGNVGVNAPGGMISASSHNEIDGAQSQVVADVVRASERSRCAALFSNASPPMPACGPATPVTLPLLANPAAGCGFPSPFPSGPAGGCGQNAKVVFDGDTIILKPGTYGDVRVFSGGNLVLSGGSQPYVFCSLVAGRGARVTAQHAATVQILNSVNLSNATFLGPDPAAQPPVSARDVQLFVNGPAVHFSGHSDVHARLCAPNGMLRITHGSNIEGNFVARTIRTERITAGVPPGGGTTTTTSTTTTTRPAGTSTTHLGTTTTTTPGPPCSGDTRKLCGNGRIDCSEECDGQDFGARTCPGASTSEHLKCRSDCTVDPSGCLCGNGIVDASEECDPGAVPTGCPAGKTCGAASDPASACRCVVKEICGNCIDDDGNGLTDFEDPACCPEHQSFTMQVTRGRLRPRGTRSKLVLRSILGSAGLEKVNPLKQDVFIQIRQPNGGELLCAHAPATKFMKMHHAFKFWDRKHKVASVKGIQDIKVIPPRKKRHDTRFRAFGKKVELQTPAHGPLEVTVGFHDPTTDAGNICSSQVKEFRAGARGRLLAP